MERSGVEIFRVVMSGVVVSGVVRSGVVKSGVEKSGVVVSGVEKFLGLPEWKSPEWKCPPTIFHHRTVLFTFLKVKIVVIQSIFVVLVGEFAEIQQNLH